MKRNNSLDLLRILSMFFVVILHTFGHSNVLSSLKSDEILFYPSHLLLSFARIAVPVFVLITGYFGIRLTAKKWINMELKLYLYSAIGFVIAFILRRGFDFTLMELLKTALPFSYKSWWFATMYLALMLLSPFINRFLEACSQKEHLGLIITCFVIYNVICTISLDPIDTTGGYSIANFILLYASGRYIRKYGFLNRLNKYHWLALYGIFSVLIVISYLLYGSYKFGTYNSILLFCSSVSLFMFVSKTNINAPVFSKIAPYTFAVYLLSDHFLLRAVVNKLPMYMYTTFNGQWYVFFLIILYSLAIMGVCMLVDFLVTLVLGKLLDKIADLLSNICLKIKNLFIKIFLKDIEKQEGVKQ